MAAALQHLDHDVYWDLWTPPAFLIDKQRLKGLPQHGIGRSCKAGKEEIMGLLAALRIFTSEGDAVRHARWLKAANEIANGCMGIAGIDVHIRDAENSEGVPLVVLSLDRARHDAPFMISALHNGNPSIHVDPSQREKNKILLNPMCLKYGEPAIIAAALRRALV